MPPSNPLTRPVRRRSRGLETRAAILGAAEQRFAESGYEAARLEDIGADVGIRRAAIFYHYRDKNELYAAVLENVLRSSMRAMPSEGSAKDRLEATLSGWIDYVAERPNAARLILREAANAQPGVTSPLARVGRKLIDGFRAVIDEGVASGELQPLTDPHRLVSLMGATTLFHFATMAWLSSDVSVDPWSQAALETYKRDTLQLARTMLGIQPQPLAEAARSAPLANCS